ncbi:hypothetical protein C173_06031 [Paenibacillus sp. FSL R7-277]|nr:hypothetical protein C173_06031 [Paenibacillus sp. FSL R7-277]
MGFVWSYEPLGEFQAEGGQGMGSPAMARSPGTGESVLKNRSQQQERHAKHSKQIHQDHEH